MGQSQIRAQLAEKILESSPVKKDLGVLVVKKLDMHLLCALASSKDNSILNFIQRRLANRQREVSATPQLFPCVAHLEHCMQACGPPQARCGDVGVSPEKGHEDDQRAETPLCGWGVGRE